MKILGGGSDHTRSADVDLLDQLVELGLGGGGGARERVQIDDDEVDGVDPMLPDRREIIGPISPREDPTVHRRVQGLDSAVHHLWKTRDIRHTEDTEPGV